ncbi:unnamed protein product [Mytilus edulis]|uniref:Uncharacterized protein n=1 Tax=Mytilus edulis TaxID=6550 RepID=A0A8S3PNY2_MYTED|nr:unnamed protein product [Mytilus edulis]
MAQVLAESGDVRHGFSYIGKRNHDFGRITGIAVTIKGNILLCDYDERHLILVGPYGNYLKKLDVDSEPYDMAITSQNIGYVTQPNSKTVLQIDPDRMVLLFKTTCTDLNTSVLCVTTTQTFLYFGVIKDGCVHAGGVNEKQISSSIRLISNDLHEIGLPVVKFHIVNNTYLSCIGGRNYIKYYKSVHEHGNIPIIATMDTPTDICSDNYDHIYVSGQGSNNIHRLEDVESKKTRCERAPKRTEKDWKVLDIPLDSQHGIKEPVAVCFNKDFITEVRIPCTDRTNSSGLCCIYDNEKNITEKDMAQVLAVPGHVRHGFSYVGQFNHDFGRITGIAATIKGNILLCDYDKKNLILVDPLGNYLKKLNVDSEPYDIAITSQNIGYITKPKSRSVIQIDPDRMGNISRQHATT